METFISNIKSSMSRQERRQETRNAIKKDAVTGTWAPEKWWTLEWWTSPGKPRTKQDDDDSTSFGIKMSARDGLQNSSEVANPEAGL